MGGSHAVRVVVHTELLRTENGTGLHVARVLFAGLNYLTQQIRSEKGEGDSVCVSKSPRCTIARSWHPPMAQLPCLGRSDAASAAGLGHNESTAVRLHVS